MTGSVLTHNSSETQKYGEKLAEKLKNGGIVCLYGELGAGKTTLVQGIAKGLGIKQRINSPTFIIARKYDNFWHIDLYRLNSLEETEAIGIKEILEDTNNIVVIEWPEKIKNILPKHYVEIKLRVVSELEREIHETIY